MIEPDSGHSPKPNVTSGRKIAQNLGWLSGGHVLRILIALPASILVARYLGPENFGMLSYANALVGLFLPLATLGLGEIVVRDLVRGKHDYNETMGASFLLRFVGAILVIILATGTVIYLQPDQIVVQLIVVVVALRSVFLAFEVIDYWFQSNVNSQPVIKSRIVATTGLVLIQVALVLYKAPLLAFAVATAIESFLLAVILIYVYRRKNRSVFNWKPTFERGRRLLAESWPLTATTFAIVIQSYIDQVMLGQMRGNEVVGQYSIAIYLITVIAFLPVALQKSWAPSVTAAKKQDQSAYARRLSRLYQLMFGVFLLQGIPIFFLAKPIVKLLYGVEYAEAGALLALLAIRLLFTNYGLARSLFIANESLFRHALMTAVAGTLVNIGVNYLLIPSYGARGAIVATILSYVVTLFALDALNHRTRKNLILMLASPFAALSSVKRLLARKKH